MVSRGLRLLIITKWYLRTKVQCYKSESAFLFSASAAGKQLKVSDETEQTMNVTWTPAPGKVVNYRLKHVPSKGGKEVVLKIGGAVTSTVMKRLQPMTTYNITVLPIYKRGEGKARQGVGTTRTLVHNSTL